MDDQTTQPGPPIPAPIPRWEDIEPLWRDQEERQERLDRYVDRRADSDED